MGVLGGGWLDIKFELERWELIVHAPRWAILYAGIIGAGCGGGGFFVWACAEEPNGGMNVNCERE